MATYSNSEATKTALIMAAGELFVEQGTKAVTTRAIAKKAGENIGSIKYHFGSKDGLLDAVIDYATRHWCSDPLGHYLKDNEHLFRTREGQARLVTGFIDNFLGRAFSKDRPPWCGMLIFQLMQRDIPASKKIFESSVSPVQNAFCSLYARIAGDNDEEMAICWMLTTAAPAHLLSADPQTFKKIHRVNTVPESLLQKVRNMIIKSALVNLGLFRYCECGQRPGGQA
ncbi:MAG: hypothetical protein A2X49_13610 [Lentisphaerae bacterium GWF2_52_8]|nr:MAG: hypothetical protein A2X49_13610 [Lentisphaerae bacterium GWF2_52_8]